MLLHIFFGCSAKAVFFSAYNIEQVFYIVKSDFYGITLTAPSCAMIANLAINA